MMNPHDYSNYGLAQELKRQPSYNPKIIAEVIRRLMLNPYGDTLAAALPGAAQGAEPVLPDEATDAMCEAAMEAHYGKQRVRACGGARGIDMTVNDTGYNGLQAFKRMWRGAVRALAASPQPPAAQKVESSPWSDVYEGRGADGHWRLPNRGADAIGSLIDLIEKDRQPPTGMEKKA